MPVRSQKFYRAGFRKLTTPFPRLFTAKESLDLFGFSFTSADSFDSSDPTYSTGGRYDYYKFKAGADIFAGALALLEAHRFLARFQVNSPAQPRWNHMHPSVIGRGSAVEPVGFNASGFLMKSSLTYLESLSRLRTATSLTTRLQPFQL
jgi:hypothetical protein